MLKPQGKLASEPLACCQTNNSCCCSEAEQAAHAGTCFSTCSYSHIMRMRVYILS